MPRHMCTARARHTAAVSGSSMRRMGSHKCSSLRSDSKSRHSNAKAAPFKRTSATTGGRPSFREAPPAAAACSHRLMCSAGALVRWAMNSVSQNSSLLTDSRTSAFHLLSFSL
eukprot:9478437-Pyramimonas_sp.AAC.1